MRILGGALPATDTFLHVGYTSAAPRKFIPERAYDARNLILHGTPIDVAAALRLKDEPATPESAAIQVPSAGLIWVPNAVSQTIVMFVGAFVVGVMALYTAKRCQSSKGRFALISAAIACALVGAMSLFASARLYAIALPPPDTKPPWEGVATRAYADPVNATRVLMHGIVGDALANAGRSVLTLAQLKDEVGIPTAHPTAGERYALQTYGLDGWGHPFRLERRNLEIVDKSAVLFRSGHPVGGSSFHGLGSETPRYILTSAGSDGAFDTPDDLRAVIKAAMDVNWDEGLRGLYIHRDGDTYVTLFHRWRGITFTYANRAWAKKLTGGDLYDLDPVDAVDEWFSDPEQQSGTPKTAMEAVQGVYARIGCDAERPPLVLLIPFEGTVRHE